MPTYFVGAIPAKDHYANITEMKKILFLTLLTIFFIPVGVHSQEVHEDIQGIWKARVVEVVEQEMRTVPGTDTVTQFQKLRAEILEGEKKGEVVLIENDYLSLKEGDKFFLNYLITINGAELYSVGDVDRRGSLLFLFLLFAGTVIVFGGKQGVRSLLSLAGSFSIIIFVLLPLLLKGFSPIPLSVAIASAILFVAIYFTHGFNRESTVAFVGTSIAVVLTGLLATFSVSFAKLSGFGTDEAVYLNIFTGGTLNFTGLLLGAIMIGVLGVLDDIAITQSAVVSELYSANPNMTKKEVYRKAIRVGKEHVGALVNTLALAYAGASLPLLLLFYMSEAPTYAILNSEALATEIVRTIVGSIGLILAVPITTLLAAHFLRGYKSTHSGHSHGHGHIH